MSDISNSQRATWALDTLAHFAGITGLTRSGDFAPDNIATALGDLLANLRHLCREAGVDFDEIANGSREVFDEELADEENEEDHEAVATDADCRALQERFNNVMMKTGEVCTIEDLADDVVDVEETLGVEFDHRQIAKAFRDAANNAVDSWIENQPENAEEYNRQRPQVQRRAALEAAGLDALVNMLDEPKPASPIGVPELVAIVERFVAAGLARDAGAGDPIRLGEVRAELWEAVQAGSRLLEQIRGKLPTNT